MKIVICILILLNVALLVYSIFLWLGKKQTKKLSVVLTMFAFLTVICLILVFKTVGGFNRIIIGGFYKPAEDEYVRLQALLIDFRDPRADTLYAMLDSSDRIERYYAVLKLAEVESDPQLKISKMIPILSEKDSLWMGGKTKCFKCNEELRTMRIEVKALKVIKVLGIEEIRRYLRTNPDTPHKDKLDLTISQIKAEKCEINSNRYFRASWEQVCEPSKLEDKSLCECTRYDRDGKVTKTFTLMEKDAVERRQAKFNKSEQQ